MGIISSGGANESAQLWIAARLIEAASLMTVPLLIGRRLSLNYLLPAIGMFALLVAASIMNYPIFPDCHQPHSGKSTFMYAAELATVAMLAGAFLLIRLRREYFSDPVRHLLLAAVVLIIGSELCFLLNADRSGAHDVTGLLLKIISTWLIYIAVVRTGLVRPLDLLFRNLKMREREREQLIEQLQNALGEVKILSGMLPICASCKQIRDDRGYWYQVEEYIHSHSETEFTHSYCPDCARKLLDSIE